MSKVERELERAMTVADLIAELEQYDADAPVLFTCDYGDYHHTQQALPCQTVDQGDSRDLKESGYSQSGIALVTINDEKLYFCPKCEKEMDYTVCPKCGTTCVNEDGTPADPDEDDDGREVVIINLSN